MHGLYLLLGLLLLVSVIFGYYFAKRTIKKEKLSKQREQHRKLLLQIIESGGVNVTDNVGNTPLILAVRYGFMDVLEKLIVLKPNFNASDNNGNTALHFAAALNNIPAIEQLSENGANINATTQIGLTPIMIAIKANTFGVIRFLIEKKADLTRTNDAGQNAIDFAQEIWFDGADSTEKINEKEEMYAALKGELANQTV